MRRIRAVAIAGAAVGSWCFGCAAPSAPARPAPAPPLARAQLDGVVIRAEPDPLTRLSVYDADDLFHLARDMARDDRLEDAITVYRRLLEEMPDASLREPALYNLALLYERTERWAEAVETYRRLIDEGPSPGEEGRRTWVDAHFRVAVCHGKRTDWWQAVAAFDVVLAEPWLSDEDRLEALVGRGIALHEAGEAESAEVALSGALRFARELDRRAPLGRDGLAAEAAFRLGEIADDGYRSVVLEFPIETLRERLEEKCARLLSAQHRYLRALRYGDAHTVAAAGYRIGNLYESLYDSILALEVPPELTEEQAELYQQEVRRRIHVLVEKALKVYEQALLVGRSATTAADWTARLEASIARLRTLALADS